MKRNELGFYEKIGNWNFDEIKRKVEKESDWDFYKKISEFTDEKSLCLDLGTGGGENLLKGYPEVGVVIGIDFSSEMIATARKNLEESEKKNVRFLKMDNLDMRFPDETFELISARHTKINAEEVYRCLVPGGVVVIQGVDKKDCWRIKEVFGRGQGYNDEVAISEVDYRDLEEAGFKILEKREVVEYEYYETEEDLLALLLKTPILDDFSKVDENEDFEHRKVIEKDLFEKFVKENACKKGICLKRVLYGIVARK